MFGAFSPFSFASDICLATLSMSVLNFSKSLGSISSGISGLEPNVSVFAFGICVLTSSALIGLKLSPFDCSAGFSVDVDVGCTGSSFEVAAAALAL